VEGKYSTSFKKEADNFMNRILRWGAGIFAVAKNRA